MVMDGKLTGGFSGNSSSDGISVNELTTILLRSNLCFSSGYVRKYKCTFCAAGGSIQISYIRINNRNLTTCLGSEENIRDLTRPPSCSDFLAL